MITGALKADLGFSLEYALYDLSYTNLILYTSTLPSYNSRKSGIGKGGDGGKINADDPKNKNEVLKILSGN